MIWRTEFAFQVEHDVAEAAEWYENRETGPGDRFVEDIIHVWDALAHNPLLGCRRHPVRNIYWRYAERFPYRVIYELSEDEKIVRVAAVLHGARSDHHWQRRI